MVQDSETSDFGKKIQGGTVDSSGRVWESVHEKSWKEFVSLPHPAKAGYSTGNPPSNFDNIDNTQEKSSRFAISFSGVQSRDNGPRSEDE